MARKPIVDNVLNRCDHPTAQDIHRDLKGHGIGLATVYRNLALLAEEGVISTVEHEGEVRYDCNNMPHGHATCTKCGALWDIPFHQERRRSCTQPCSPRSIPSTSRCEARATPAGDHHGNAVQHNPQIDRSCRAFAPRCEP